MKFNKFAIVLSGVALLSLTACQKDQDDVFAESSSVRLEAYMEKVRSLLQDSSNGWLMSYVPGSTEATCYFGLVFTDQTVTAYSQSDPANGVTSPYKFTEDNSAMLSFDSYNSVLHYYATADSDHYQARGGDFEFVIMNVTDERITLKGRRSHNLCYLDKLSEAPSTYLQKMNDAESALAIVAFEGVVKGGLVEGFLDASSHTISIGRKGAESAEMVSARYMVVAGGIHLNSPITFNGVSFSDFVYDDAAGTFTGSGIVFKKIIPEGFVSYKDFLGKYTFTWNSGSRNFQVELVELDKDKTFKLKGFSTYFEPVIGYNGAMGYLTWNTQAIGVNGSNTVMLCAWDSEAGYLTWNTDVGLEGRAVDNTVAAFTISWNSNGAWENYTNDSWLIWQLDANGSSAGAYQDWTTATGNYQVPGPFTMVKIVE